MLVTSAACARAADAPSPEALQAADELLAILSPDMMKHRCILASSRTAGARKQHRRGHDRRIAQGV